MPVSDNQVPAAFRLTCNAVCGCVSNVEELRQIWQFYRQDGKGKFHCDGIAGTLLRLTYHLKRAKGAYPDVAWIIRTLYKEPPESVAGFSGATYHEIAINLAETVVWQIATTAKLGIELLDPLAGSDLSDTDLWKLLNSQRAQIVAKVSIDRVEGEYFWEEWSKALDSLPVLDANNLIARIKIEAAHGAQQASELPVKNGSNLDRKFMERAVEEARKSKTEDDRVHPKVGVVIVKDGKELAVAHRGELDEGDHAEFTALEKKLADKVIAGATVYTTLEPCTTRSHSKLPCAVRLIARKVRRVVIGILDPNPKISGKGFHKLREANIDVDLFPPDLMSKIEEMNWEFIRHHKSMAESGPLESGANQEKITLKRRKNSAKKAATAEFLRLMAGEWHLRFSKGGKQIGEERCRIDTVGGYYLLDRQPGQLWCKIEDVQYDAVTRNATFIKVKMRGKRWRHTETVVVLPDDQRMEGHDDRGQSLVYERLIAGSLTGPLTGSGVFEWNQPLRGGR